MNYLGKQKNTLFIGQAVEVPGTAMTNTLNEINRKKLNNTIRSINNRER